MTGGSAPLRWRLLGLLVLGGLLLAACSDSAEEEAYLESVEAVQDQVDQIFEELNATLETSYQTREIFFGARLPVLEGGLRRVLSRPGVELNPALT